MNSIVTVLPPSNIHLARTELLYALVIDIKLEVYLRVHVHLHVTILIPEGAIEGSKAGFLLAQCPNYKTAASILLCLHVFLTSMMRWFPLSQIILLMH